MKKILVSLFVFVSVFSVDSFVYAVTPQSDYSQSIIAIDAFLTNPTIENFKTFCTVAKTLSGFGESKILNDTRTDYVMKKNTLYENVGYQGSECALALGENKYSSRYKWITYSASYLVEFKNPNESDAVRKFKVDYNNIWKSMSSYKLIGFAYGKDVNISTPDQWVEKITSGNEERIREYKYALNRSSFITPEKVLAGIRKQLIKTPSSVSVESTNKLSIIPSVIPHAVSTEPIKTTFKNKGNTVPLKTIKKDTTEIIQTNPIVSSEAIVSSQTTNIKHPSAPQNKIGWFRRFINWFR